jgi:transposase
VAIPPAEHARLLAEVRRARDGDWLALPLLWLWAAGRTPTDIAALLFCARSTVYRGVRASQAGTLTFDAPAEEDARRGRLRTLTPSRKRSVLALLQTVPRACGGCRTRWSCTPLAVEVQARRGLRVSAEPVRRGRHELGWGWKRAKLAATEADPQRVEKVACRRSVVEHWPAKAALFFADGLDISLLPKVGDHGRPQGEQVEVPTPGTTERRSLAGALALRTGTSGQRVWWRTTHGLLLDLLKALDQASPVVPFPPLSVGVDNSKLPYAEALEKGLAAPPRVKVRFLPPYGPKANPLERAFGDVHEKWTRNHTRKRMGPLGQDVERQLQGNGPWTSALSDLYDTPEVPAAVEALRAAETAQEEPSQLAA